LLQILKSRTLHVDVTPLLGTLEKGLQFAVELGLKKTIPQIARSGKGKGGGKYRFLKPVKVQCTPKSGEKTKTPWKAKSGKIGGDSG